MMQFISHPVKNIGKLNSWMPGVHEQLVCLKLNKDVTVASMQIVGSAFIARLMLIYAASLFNTALSL